VAKLRGVLERAREAGVSPQYILTSPYTRALETAKLAKEILGFEEDLIETGVLLPYRGAVEVWEEIRLYRDAGELMVVGHNPLLSDFVRMLTGAGGYGVGMKKGAIARVEVPSFSGPPRGILTWLLRARRAGE
jgi:phosphohistidine phosphatase SixA